MESAPSSFLGFLYELARIKISGSRLVDLPIVADEHGDLYDKHISNKYEPGTHIQPVC